MFDPFPTFPLPPCDAFGGLPMETACGCVERCIGCGALPGERPHGCHSREDAGCVFCTDATDCRLTDGHHEGDPAPVIGWGESVRRVLS